MVKIVNDFDYFNRSWNIFGEWINFTNYRIEKVHIIFKYTNII